MPTIETVMTRDPVCCTADDSVIECAKAMARENVGCIPVVESQDTRKLIGVVTDRDLCLDVIAEGRDPDDVTVGECMSEDLVTLEAGDDLDDVLRLMQENQLRRILIVDEDFACVGIVSQADIAQAAPSQQVQRTVAQISRPDV